MARLNGTRECLRNFAAFPGPKLCPFICHSGRHHCESGQAHLVAQCCPFALFGCIPLFSDLPKDSLCLHLVVIDCKFVVRKVFGMTLPKTACPVWKSHDGLNLTCFGSMPWRSFPWHKHLPRLAQRNCYTVDSLNLIHKFKSLFR